MSQPILVLSNPTRPDIDTDDVSDQSNSPGLSSPVSCSTSLQDHFIGAPKVSVQSTFPNSSGFPLRDTPLKTQSNGAGTVNSNATPFNEPMLDPLKPGAPVKRPLSNSVDLTFDGRRPSSKQSPPISTAPLSLSLANSDGTIGPNVQIATRIPKVNTRLDQGLLMYSSTPALLSDDVRNVVIERARDSPSLQESPSNPHVPKRERVGPKLTLNTTMNIDIDGINSGISSAINTTSSQQPPFPPIPRRTVSSAPRLSLPPANYRFSLNLVDGYSARMSPSVILRPPPLPLNLPVLPDITGSTLDTTSSRRSKRAGLMSMPALPRHGTSRGTSRLEELDDVEDEDEDEDDGDSVDDDDGPDNTSLEDESDTPLSDSSTSEISSSRSRSPSSSVSSHETFHESSTTPHDHEGYISGLTTPKKNLSTFPFLPPMDVSRIDLSFLDSPPPKNKGKAKELTEDAGRTPIATAWSNRNGGTRTPTSFRIMDFGTKTDSWAASPVVPKSSYPSSPSQTPRPGGHFKLPLPVPNTPSSARLTPTRSTTENRLSVLSMNSISQFPGTYSRASQSLIDVHALEKKEKVEKLVREEEEGAEEERKRRIKAKRMSMRVVAECDDHATTMSHDQSGGDVDGRSETFAPIRMSLTPNRIDPVQASEASSSPTAKQPKTNNRISMAPAYETILPLRRRLSMPTFNATSTPPPPYPDLFPNAQTYGVKPTQIQPRDDEGREKLPAYSNSIYIKAIMPRKLEFSQPGVQAKDRKWKRVLCVLEGTSFKVYKPPGVSAIEEWWENKVGVGDIAMMTTTSSNSASRRQTAQGGGAEGTSRAVRQSKEEVEMERVRMRDVTATRPPTQFGDARQRQGSSPSYPSSNHTGGPVLPAAKSALNLAVHLLKPSSRGHARTNSDIGQSSNTPSVPQSSRPSLNIPMNGRSTRTPTIGSTTTTITSRSSSPMFAASSSSLLTTPAGSSWSHGSTDSTSSSTGSGARSMVVTDNYTAVASSSTSSSTSKGKRKADDSDLLPDKHSLIKAYTMQQAESGLGSDYVKRKHVIRVRLEDEQFLLQASDVDSVIEWIEVSFPFLSFFAIFDAYTFTCRGYRLRQILRWT